MKKKEVLEQLTKLYADIKDEREKLEEKTEEFHRLMSALEKWNLAIKEGEKIGLKKGKLEDKKVQDLLKKRNFLGYYKTSAKTGNGVYEAFQAIIKELYNKYKDA